MTIYIPTSLFFMFGLYWFDFSCFNSFYVRHSILLRHNLQFCMNGIDTLFVNVVYPFSP